MSKAADAEATSPKPGHAVRASGEPSSPSKGGGGSARKGELEKNNSRSILRLPVHLRGRSRTGSTDDTGLGREDPKPQPGFSLDLLSDSQQRRVQEAFSRFDRNGSGKIDAAEMRQVRQAHSRAHCLSRVPASHWSPCAPSGLPAARPQPDKS